jgi:hypothetical protein
MSLNQQTSGYNCTTCGKRHTFSDYMLARQHVPLAHRCDLCGAAHNLLNGVATLTLPGHVPARTTQFELDIAAAPIVEEVPQVTGWFEGTPPQREGYYHIRFPNGTEADRNWWFDPVCNEFLYDKTSTVGLSFGAIGAWRGLDKQYF